MFASSADCFAPTASTPDGRNLAHLGARTVVLRRLWQAMFLAAIGWAKRRPSPCGRGVGERVRRRGLRLKAHESARKRGTASPIKLPRRHLARERTSRYRGHAPTYAAMSSTGEVPPVWCAGCTHASIKSRRAHSYPAVAQPKAKCAVVVALEVTLRSVSSCVAMWPSMRRADAPSWWRRTNNNDEWVYVLHLAFTPPKKKPAMRRVSF